MLLELQIRDLALIDGVTLAFGPGLNAITGETGAGKSLLVDALELVLGLRPKPGLVRQGATRAEVSARFALPRGAAGERIERWLKKNLAQTLEDWRGLKLGEERELILSRTVTSDGRTRAHVNGRAVTLRALAELAPRLFEIHGQNDHQRLFDPQEQLRLLDEFGRLAEDLKGYRVARGVWLAKVELALRLEDQAVARASRLEIARHELGELEALAPDPDESSALTAEREILRHSSELIGMLVGLVDELSDRDQALVSRVELAARTLAAWRERVSALAPAAEALEAAATHLQDGARTLRSLCERVEADPARLEAIEERLAELERLGRKHATDCAGLVEKRTALAAEIGGLESDEASSAGIGDELAVLRDKLLTHARHLRRARKALREKLAHAVQETLKQLGLERASFDLRLGQRADHEDPAPDASSLRAACETDLELFGERGIDRIEFLLSANPGEAQKRLRDVASGGETSRIMLALRSVLAGAGAGRTLVFDEIDSGVGGRLGPAVGTHLVELGRHHQILCVTHLPAIAAVAARHLRVHKVVERGRTLTRVEELAGDARVEEVADMIAGGSAHETARAEARRLIGR